MPVDERAIESFPKIWSKYDPYASHFIPIRQLENLLEDLASDEDTKDLVMFPERIVDVKDEEGNIVKDNSVFRKRMIIMLDIPTYKCFTEVMFFDVLQQICNKKVEIHHNAERIKENKQKLKIIKLFSQSPNVYDDTLQALEIPNIKTDYDIDYEKLIDRMTTANSKIQLIQALNDKTKLLFTKYNS